MMKTLSFAATNKLKFYLAQKHPALIATTCALQIEVLFKMFMFYIYFFLSNF